MLAELAGGRSDWRRLLPGAPAHCIPLRNAMPGLVRVSGQPTGAPVVPGTCSRLPRGWQQRGRHRSARRWICGQREGRCPHIHRRRISRSVRTLYLFKAGTAARTVTANALAVPAGPAAPRMARYCRMTRFHRGVPCQARCGTEQERSGQITSYKNRTC
jgi:hypothetical protein